MALAGRRKTQAVAGLILISIITWISHWRLGHIGYQLLHSDFAATWLVSDDFRAGHWSAFLYQMSYAGIAWTAVRAAWMGIYEGLLGGEYYRGQAFFTYWGSPLLLAWSAFFLGRSYLRSFWSAVLMAILAGCGLYFWIPQWGNDTYIAYLALGCILLGLRAGVENPWKEWSWPRLLIAAVLSGFALYISRISMIFLLGVWAPWGSLPDLVRELAGYFAKPDSSAQLFRQTRNTTRIAAWAGALFFALFLFLEIHGPDLGTWAGRKVKLHAQPNLGIALLCWSLLLARPRYRSVMTQYWKKALIFASGMAIGFLPELLYQWSTGRSTGTTQTAARSIPDALTVLIHIPQTLHTILSSDPHATWQWIFTLGLFIMSGVLIFRQILPHKERWALGASAILAIVAFCRVHNYAGPEPRYLIPLFPWIWLAWGHTLDLALEKKNWLTVTPILVFFAAQIGVHFVAETAFAEKIVQERLFEQKTDLIQRFRTENIEVVISNDYWMSNELSVFSRRQPWFVPETMQHMTPPEAIRLAKTEKQVGAVWATPILTSQTTSILNRDCRVKKELGQVLGKYLYLMQCFEPTRKEVL